MTKLEHSALVSESLYRISNFKIGKLHKNNKCHKFSAGKSKQYYILTAELVDPNYLKLSRLNR